MKENNCTCPVCGKEFHLKPYALKRFKRHFCSKECQNEDRKTSMAGEGNHQYGLKRELNASWKGDAKRSNSHGYTMIRDFDHPCADKGGWVFEHRVVAENNLATDENSDVINGRRCLKKGYEVHHINFDRRDNRPENLLVLTHQQHKLIHSTLNPNARNEAGRYIKEEKQIVKVKKVSETATIPEAKTIGAVGYDLCVDSETEIVIPPHSTVMAYSGLAFEFPKDYYGLIYARSGISTKRGLRPATCVSVIDNDYRGNVGLPLHNDTDEPKVIAPKERVAQIIFEKALRVEIEIVDTLDDTERGDNGFGSTGK